MPTPCGVYAFNETRCVNTKRPKKIFLAAIAAALLLACLPGAALAADADYRILSDDVCIVISEDNIASVTETLVVDFAQSRHGIYYNVQYEGTGWYYENVEWCGVPYSQRVYDFDVQDQPFELSEESDEDGSAFLIAKIGDPAKTITGRQTYVVTYKCDLGEDTEASMDLFYRDLIRCADGFTIEKASFSVEFPKDFDEGAIEVTMGYKVKNDSEVEWKKNGNTVTGRALRPLTGGESITLKAELKDGYFKPKFQDLPEGLLALLILIAGI